MKASPPPSTDTTPSPTGGGAIWRLLLGTATVLGISTFLADLIRHPSKRNIQLLAGIAFLATVLIANPYKALLFAIALIPFPAYTSVGSTSMLMIFAVAGLVVVKGKQLDLQSPFIRRDTDIAMSVLLLMGLLSFYYQPASDVIKARFVYLGLVSAAVVYYMIIYLLNDRDRLWTAVRLTQVLAILLSLLGLYQWMFPDRQLLPEFFSFSRRVAEMEDIRRGHVRVMGTFQGQELMAEYLAMSLVLQFVLFRHARHPYEKALWVVGSVLGLAALFATATRGGLIVLAGGYFYLLAFGSRVIPRQKVAVVGFFVLALGYLTLPFTSRLMEFMLDRMSTVGPSDGSLVARQNIGLQALREVAKQPVLGHGLATPMGTFEGPVTMNIHNVYITLAYSMGIPALLAFLSLVYRLLRCSWSTAQNRLVSQDMRELAMGLHVALVMFLVDELKIEFTRQPMYMQVVWTYFGLIMATWRVSNDQLRNSGAIQT